MCNASCIGFAGEQISRADVAGKLVLEVGSLDVNGSVRQIIEPLAPAAYTGIDIEPGPGVDELCDVGQLMDRYGRDQFDLVLSTELVEHVRDWRTAFSNLKGVLRPGGQILVTTRSRGFPLHGYPSDYWRYEPDDMRRIFADFDAVLVQRDPEEPGVFVKAQKPIHPRPAVALDAIELFSVIDRRRVHEPTRGVDFVYRLAARIARSSVSLSVRNRVALRTRIRRRRAGRKGLGETGR